MISLFHKIALAQIVPDTLSAEENLNELVNLFTPEELQLYYQIALLCRRDLALTPSPQQGFEMTLLRMLAFKPDSARTENKPVTKPALIKASDPIAATPKTVATSAPIEEIAVKTAIESVEWREILPHLGLSGMAYALASNCTLISQTDQKIELALATSHQPMLNSKLKERITESLSRYLGHSIQLDISTTTVEIITPVKQKQEEQDQRLSQAKKTIMQNPQVKKLIEMYDATVEVSLLN
jgi:DNA polymerase-3 subunit gamma/tau